MPLAPSASPTSWAERSASSSAVWAAWPSAGQLVEHVETAEEAAFRLGPLGDLLDEPGVLERPLDVGRGLEQAGRRWSGAGRIRPGERERADELIAAMEPDDRQRAEPARSEDRPTGRAQRQPVDRAGQHGAGRLDRRQDRAVAVGHRGDLGAGLGVQAAAGDDRRPIAPEAGDRADLRSAGRAQELDGRLGDLDLRPRLTGRRRQAAQGRQFELEPVRGGDVALDVQDAERLAVLVDQAAERGLDHDLATDRPPDPRSLDHPAVPGAGRQGDLAREPVRDVDLADDRGVGQLVDRLPDRSAGLDAVQPLGRDVPEADPCLEVGDDERVVGRGGHDPQGGEGRRLVRVGTIRRRSRVGFGHGRILRSPTAHDRTTRPTAGRGAPRGERTSRARRSRGRPPLHDHLGPGAERSPDESRRSALVRGALRRRSTGHPATVWQGRVPIGDCSRRPHPVGRREAPAKVRRHDRMAGRRGR